MASTPLDQNDIIEYVQTFTDFSFEMKVQSLLKHLRFSVEHSGTYIDPVTHKNREFDIRAKNKLKNFPYFFHLSVECKNISPAFPLIVQEVQRNRSESFHETVQFNEHGHPKVVRNKDSHILYPAEVHSWVAKSMDQVGRKGSNLSSSEGKTYDKMSQAINSAETLLQQTHFDRTQGHGMKYLVLPIFVVPDGCLWQVRYSENGDPLGAPIQIEHSKYFVNLKWTHNSSQKPYTISHLEIVTLSGLNSFAKELIQDSKDQNAQLFV